MAEELGSTLQYQFEGIRPQWFHPFFLSRSRVKLFSKEQLQSFAYDYYLRFLPFFRDQLEGDLKPGVNIEFTRKMKQKLGMASLFDRIIKLNQDYFSRDPILLPYTLFHELIHQWLYDCFYDPGHTKRFYRKMAEFCKTGLPIDPGVHIHSRLAPDSKYVYVCSNCGNRWYTNERGLRLNCGYCYNKYGFEIRTERIVNTPPSLQSFNSKAVNNEKPVFG